MHLRGGPGRLAEAASPVLIALAPAPRSYPLCMFPIVKWALLGLNFSLVQLAVAQTVVPELSLYPASKWIGPAHPQFVNATTYYCDDIAVFCTGPLAGIADQIVVTPDMFELDGLQVILCTLEVIYLHVQQSGAAALMLFSLDPCAGRTRTASQGV